MITDYVSQTHTVCYYGLIAESMPIYSVKRSDATGNPFEWQLGENNVI